MLYYWNKSQKEIIYWLLSNVKINRGSPAHRLTGAHRRWLAVRATPPNRVGLPQTSNTLTSINWNNNKIEIPFFETLIYEFLLTHLHIYIREYWEKERRKARWRERKKSGKERDGKRQRDYRRGGGCEW